MVSMRASYLLFLTLCFFASCSKEFNDPKGGTGCTLGSDASSIQFDGQERQYLIHIPSTYDSTLATPLLLNFHGFGGQADYFRNETDMVNLSDNENFILVYPQGTCLDGSAHWNPSLPSPDNKSSVDDLGFIEALVNEIAGQYNVDLERIYACGYSNGGMMSYGLACEKSELIAAVGSVSGAMLDLNCNSNRPKPVIMIHGTNDGVIPYEGGADYNSVQSTLDSWINHNNADQTPTVNTITSGNLEIEYIRYANGDSSTAVEHYKIVNGEHVWFDLDVNGRNTGAIVWDFVSQYDINGLR